MRTILIILTVFSPFLWVQPFKPAAVIAAASYGFFKEKPTIVEVGTLLPSQAPWMFFVPDKKVVGGWSKDAWFKLCDLPNSKKCVVFTVVYDKKTHTYINVYKIVDSAMKVNVAPPPDLKVDLEEDARPE